MMESGKAGNSSLTKQPDVKVPNQQIEEQKVA
jgi:hypothetical protein